MLFQKCKISTCNDIILLLITRDIELRFLVISVNLKFMSLNRISSIIQYYFIYILQELVIQVPLYQESKHKTIN
jgi:hypothetical protein